jgi:hypothetical protein
MMQLLGLLLRWVMLLLIFQVLERRHWHTVALKPLYQLLPEETI